MVDNLRKFMPRAPIPILGQPKPVEKTFVCAEGHEMTGDRPFRIQVLAMSDGQSIVTNPICPICYAVSLSKQFPVWEKADSTEVESAKEPS